MDLGRHKRRRGSNYRLDFYLTIQKSSRVCNSSGFMHPLCHILFKLTRFRPKLAAIISYLFLGSCQEMRKREDIQGIRGNFFQSLHCFFLLCKSDDLFLMNTVQIIF